MLTVRDHVTLRFQDQHWKYAGARAAAILESFNESETRHAQRLNHLLDPPGPRGHVPAAGAPPATDPRCTSGAAISRGPNQLSLMIASYTGSET